MTNYFVYILTNQANDVYYVGFTNNLGLRTIQHQEKVFPASFSARYRTFKLVYYEEFDDAEEALKREKQLKRWRREWKRKIITELNPTWRDLGLDFLDPNPSG